MKTTVYVKTDTQDQLLLSESVCRQLGVVPEHRFVEPPKVPDRNTDAEALVPTVRVQLVKSLRIPAKQGAIVPVCCEGNVKGFQQPSLVEATQELDGLVVEGAVITPQKDGITRTVVWNNSGFTQKLGEGAVLGVIESAEELDVSPDMETTNPATVNNLICSNQEARKKKLLDALMLPTLPSDELQQLEDSSSMLMMYSHWRKVSMGRLILSSLG